MTPEMGSTNPEDLKGVASKLVETIKENNLTGNLHGSPKGKGIPMPFNARLHLSHSDPDASTGNLRFRFTEAGSIVAYGMDPQDYGMGMDTMWFGWEELIVSPDGQVIKQVNGWPNKDDAYNYRLFDQETIPPRVEYDDEQSLFLIRQLQKVADTGAALVRSRELKLPDDY